MSEPSAPSLGLVVEEGRGSLPFALIHGEALVACAAWALSEAGVTLYDSSVPWTTVQEAGEPLVLHDPLCPMTPAAYVAECVARSVAENRVVVGVRPVTDTVKVVADGLVTDTLDRSGLVTICSPIVLPPAVVAELDAPPESDFATLAARLAARYDVLTVPAPPEARRVATEDDVRLLEALTRPPQA